MIRPNVLAVLALLILTGMPGIGGTNQNMSSDLRGKTPSGVDKLLGSAVADSGNKAPASNTSASFKEKDLSDYMGTYKVIAVKKYGGGLTSKAQAMQYMGKPMIMLSTARVTVSGNSSIKAPRYTIVCQPKPTEGEVVPRGARYSDFYGFGMDRNVVSVLQVRDPADKDPTPYYEFELLRSGGKNEIWYMDDGWLYELEQAQ